MACHIFHGAGIRYDYTLISGMAPYKPETKSLEKSMEFFRKVKGVGTWSMTISTVWKDP